MWLVLLFKLQQYAKGLPEQLSVSPSTGLSSLFPSFHRIIHTCIHIYTHAFRLAVHMRIRDLILPLVRDYVVNIWEAWKIKL